MFLARFDQKYLVSVLMSMNIYLVKILEQKVVETIFPIQVLRGKKARKYVKH